MMTEIEAKTRWCPFALVPGHIISRDENGEDRKSPPISQNRGLTMGGALHNCMCLASKCMAWRWKAGLVDADFAEVGEVPLGFCGLAGNPTP